MPDSEESAATTDRRFAAPLYTVAEAARVVDVPVSTFTTWARGYERRSRSGVPVVGAPIVTTVPAAPKDALIPFVGLAEGYVLGAFRRAGVPLQRIRPALAALDEEFGVEHALASQRLYTDGAEVLVDCPKRVGDRRAVACGGIRQAAGCANRAPLWPDSEDRTRAAVDDVLRPVANYVRTEDTVIGVSAGQRASGGRVGL